jgi:hypothetical protein
VKGFSREVIEEFSSRHREIVARVGEEASLKSRDVAALDTRQRKQDISRYGEDSLPQTEKDKGRREKPESSPVPSPDRREADVSVTAGKTPVAADYHRVSGEAPEVAVPRSVSPGNSGTAGAGICQGAGGTHRQT